MNERADAPEGECLVPVSLLVDALRAVADKIPDQDFKARDLMRKAANEIDRLRKQVKEMAQEIRDTARGAAAEARWQERQGEDYGTY